MLGFYVTNKKVKKIQVYSRLLKDSDRKSIILRNKNTVIEKYYLRHLSVFTTFSHFCNFYYSNLATYESSNSCWKIALQIVQERKKGNLTCGQLRSRRFLLSDELKGNICKLLPYLTKKNNALKSPQRSTWAGRENPCHH